MTNELEMVSPASTSYTDWVGSAAAENSMIKGSNDLYDLAGLNHQEWSILAVDVTGFSHGADPDWDVMVYAVNTKDESIERHEDLKALAAERGSIPVHQIALHNVTLDDIVKCMKLLTFQLISPYFPNLDIIKRGDFPVQE